MSDSVKIVGTPYEEGQTKKSVRTALLGAFPNYRVASILRDDESERWLARLVERDGRVHHKLADDKDAPFPLKELGPEGDSDEADPGKDEAPDDSDDDSDEDVKDDSEDSADDEDKGKDVEGELKDLVKQFKKLLPALEKVVGPIDEDDAGPGDHPDDVGPVPGNGDPGLPPGGPPPGGPPPPPGRPPAGVPGPPRRPGIPGGRPKGMPPGSPFSSAQKLALQRMADVTADEAKAELLAAYPDYEVTDFTEENGQFKVILEQKTK